jgi:hypothetical protein
VTWVVLRAGALALRGWGWGDNSPERVAAGGDWTVLGACSNPLQGQV